MMRWFGKHWGAPVCDECPHVTTPVDATCFHCEEPILFGESGFILPCVTEDQHTGLAAYHYECFMRGTIGSANHMLKRCSCYVPGATECDPPELTKRQAAKLAVELWEKEQHDRHP